jgi:Uncharacterized protein conserved in bacteria (DUF2252)
MPTEADPELGSAKTSRANEAETGARLRKRICQTSHEFDQSGREMGPPRRRARRIDRCRAKCAVNIRRGLQACGDCHLMNFGGFATPERNIIFDINDLGPWEWDIKRLVASIALAARSIGLSDRKGRDCAMAAARSYREHLRDFSRMDPLRVWYLSISPDDLISTLPKSSSLTTQVLRKSGFLARSE